MPKASRQSDRPSQSKPVPSVVDPLGQLDLALPGPMQTVDAELVRRQPSLLAAIKLCISLAGFNSDKAVYIALDIDAAHWSRICKGEAHFPIDNLSRLMDLCGNEAPLLWLLEARGYDVGSLRKHETQLQRQLRAALDENEKLRAQAQIERALMAHIFAGRAGEARVV